MSAPLRTTKRWARWTAALAAAVVAGSGPLVWSVPAASAQAQDAGEAVVVDAGNPSKRLTDGASATVFTLLLPDGAACPGDSANDQYRVQSFVVPASHDPGALVYGSIKPEGDGRWSLYEVNTRPLVHALTEMNDGAGQPGRIGGFPPLSFAVFPPGELPEGRYRIGIACTRARRTERYWDTELVLTEVAEDEPGQLHWRAAGAAAVPSSGDGWSGTTVLVLAAVGAGTAAATFLLRRSRTPLASSVSREDR